MSKCDGHLEECSSWDLELHDLQRVTSIWRFGHGKFYSI